MLSDLKAQIVLLVDTAAPPVDVVALHRELAGSDGDDEVDRGDRSDERK